MGMSKRATLDHWPEETVVSDSDILVAGLSLARLVEVCGTPAVHSAASVLPGTGGEPSPTERTAVVVVRVVAVARHVTGVPIAQVDARLDNLRLVWSEARLIGRPARARSKLCLVVRQPDGRDLAECDDSIAIGLPGGAFVGDLLAIPSRSIETGSRPQLHPLTGRPDWRPSAVFDDELTALPWWETR
jgi:hypothetical protein